MHGKFPIAAGAYKILEGFARFMQHAPRIAALIVAGGTGSRMDGDLPKPYRLLGGKPLIAYSLQQLQHPAIAMIQPVIHGEHADLFAQASAGYTYLPAVYGGVTRQASVKAGMEALAVHEPDFVFIHDAARPFLSRAMVERIIAALASHEAVVPALPVYDTLRTRAGSDIPREDVLRIQTPQAFRFPQILQLHRNATHEVTDDAALWLASGGEIYYVAGEESNRKMTTSEDMDWAEAHLPRITKVGMGFDVHRLIPSESGAMILGGVHIPSAFALEGHSDADVVLHALVDAMLGAIAAGDIGMHFPPSDARWKGADSKAFVAHALGLLREAAATISHVDITVIGEQPKIHPHRETMRAQLASLLALDSRHVSVKATTTEKLGFTGRGEGLAAQVLVTVTVPAYV
jgi:2-C-methyl-D-erythritol 4-phosphate cytidylyltransferase/2-C-methyl-D-erythritol 2,4-cyclodiphosphate synthase